MNEKWFRILGIVGSVTAVAMYVAYIFLIVDNCTPGHAKSSPWQPLCATGNCTLWVLYGWFRKPKRDWPIMIANFPGVILGPITVITSLLPN